MTKYIKVIVLKFKTNKINSKKDVNIFKKYFLTVHVSMVAKKKNFLNFIHYSIQQLIKKIQSTILKIEKDTCD